MLSGNKLYGTSFYGGTGFGTVFSLELGPPPNTPPSIISQPSDISVMAGSNATFNVEATGSTPLSYRWRRGSTNLTASTRISGVTNSVLTISNVTTADAGIYSVIATNAYGMAASTGAVLTVQVTANVSLLRLAPEQANVRATDDIDAPIEPVVSANLLAGVTTALGKGVVADGVTPVLIKVQGTPAEYTLEITNNGDPLAGNDLSSRVLVLGSKWVSDTNLTTKATSGGVGTAYACLQGVDWRDLIPNRASRDEISVGVLLHPAGSDAIVGSATFRMRPPPVALVHGIADDNNTWSSDFLAALSTRWPSNFVVSVQYGVGKPRDNNNWPNTYESLGFLAAALDSELRNHFESVLTNDWAFTRYDVVAHSQGGVLTRMLCQCKPGCDDPPFGESGAKQLVVSKANFYRGRFRRVVTIGSPHNGSLISRYTREYLALPASQVCQAPWIQSQLPVRAFPKFDPFGSDITSINNGAFPVDPRIKFNCIRTAINSGGPPVGLINDPPCYWAIGLSLKTCKTCKTRGQLLLPMGSDGVVDFYSEGGGKGTKTTTMPGDIAHMEPSSGLWGSKPGEFGYIDAFGILPGHTQTHLADVGASVVELLAGPTSAFGPFVLPTLLTPSDKTNCDALVPVDNIFTATINFLNVGKSSSTAPLSSPKAVSSTSYACQIATNVPMLGIAYWSALVYSTNGISTNGVVVQVSTHNYSQAIVVVDDTVVGEVVVSATYSTTNGGVVSAGPSVVVSRSQGTLTSIELSPASATLGVGDVLSLEVWGDYNGGGRALLFISPGQAAYLSSNPGAVNISTNGVITVVGSGTATITVAYEGLSAQAVIGTAPPVIVQNPAPQTAYVGSNVLFTVVASGSDPLVYQWRKGGAPLASNARFGGVGSPFLIGTKLLASDAGNYDVIVSNACGSITSSVVRLTIPESVPPLLAIASPKANVSVSNAVCAVSGTASDNAAVSNVWYRVNNGPWTSPGTGNNWSNWTGSATLTVGSNTIRACAVDINGNFSTTNKVSLTYVVCDLLRLSATGKGTVSPNYSNAVLQIGTAKTLTAKPAAGYLFSNWVGGVSGSLAVLTNGPTLKFIMVSNLVLQANFIPNPFVPAQGSYAGLFYDTNGVLLGSSGYFTLSAASNGTFTAKLQLPAQSYSFGGKFGLDGIWQTNSLSRASGPAVRLQLDLNGGDALTGEITGTNWVAELAANRAAYSKLNPAPQGGKKYTLVISGAPEGTNQPGGCGFGTVSVDTSGNVSFTGTLGDGTNVTQSSFLSKYGEWPLYVSPYGGQGAMLGWVTFTNEPQTDFRGMVSWIKSPQPKAKYYPAGFVFTNGTEVFGSVYTNKAGTPVFGWTNGMLNMQTALLYHYSDFNGFTFGANNTATGTNKLTLTVTPSTGAFQGSVVNSQTNQTLTFKGVVFQKLNGGYGASFVTNGTGAVQIGPTVGEGPYGGLWQQIPGTIHVERYDMGGEGIGFHYPRGTNDWSNFRNGGIEMSYDSHTGQSFIGWPVTGEWIDYSVNVLEAGRYSFVVPVASTAGGSLFHFELDGTDVTGPMTIPTTGSYQTFQPIEKDGVYLPWGHHVLRLVMESIIAGGQNTLSFEVVGPGYTDGFAWNRQANWVVTNNLAAPASKYDAYGNLVWDFTVVDGGDTLSDAGSNKWWTLPRTDLAPAFLNAFSWNGDAPAFQGDCEVIVNDNDTLAPLGVWKNPVGNGAVIQVTGKILCEGDVASNTTPADYVLAVHNVSADSWTTLDTRVFVPTSSAAAIAANTRDYDGAQAMPPVVLNAGDEIVWGFKRHADWTGGMRWGAIYDDSLWFNYLGSEIPPVYTNGYVWKRNATWTVVNGMPTQNSRNDSLGSVVWSCAEMVGGDSLTSAGTHKWWTGNRILMQPGNWYGNQVFDYLGSALPSCEVNDLVIDNGSESRAPLLIWRNPCGGGTKVQVHGSVQWAGNGTSNTSPADYVLAVHDVTSNTWTVLDSMVFTPIGGKQAANAANTRNYDGAQALAPILLGPGDEIAYGFKRLGQWNGGMNWFLLDDSHLTFEKVQ